MTMACCMEHKTAGMNTPCQCSMESEPAAPVPTSLGSTVPELVPDYAVVPEPKVILASQLREPINSQWLAFDIRLRAPPKRLYLINCSLLE